LTYKGEIDVENKLEKLKRKLIIIKNQVFDLAKFQKHKSFSAYKALARPVLTYRSQEWTIRKQDEKVSPQSK
jgi:hypothetical protein